MPQVSVKLYVLVEALLYIAFNGGIQPVGGKKLAGILGVPPRYLETLLQSLVRVGILRSIRGPRGGYLLAKERRSIHMNDVIRAVRLEKQKEEAADMRSDVYTKVVAPMFSSAQQAFMEALQQITLDDLCDRAYACELHGQLTFRAIGDADYIDYMI